MYIHSPDGHDGRLERNALFWQNATIVDRKRRDIRKKRVGHFQTSKSSLAIITICGSLTHLNDTNSRTKRERIPPETFFSFLALLSHKFKQCSHFNHLSYIAAMTTTQRVLLPFPRHSDRRSVLLSPSHNPLL